MIELDEQQKQVVFTEEPKVIVAASAGSGKTRCIIERIKFLLSVGYEAKNIYAITYTNAAAEEMRTRINDSADCFIGTIHSLANRILIQNGIDTSWIIQTENFELLFEEFIKREEEIIFPQIDYLLVDEFQDICDDEYDFIFNTLKPKEFMVVGDSSQCQPAGTKVRLRNNIYKNIEDIEIGDSVCWYDPNKSFLCGPTTKAHNAIEKRVTQISYRDFVDDNLITIVTEKGETSTYTPNHRTYVKLNDNTEYNEAVYLMCNREGRFRVGKIPFRQMNKTTHSNPWRDKMRAEGCTKIWILKLFKTDKEARVFENKISYKYQIPQICWQLNKVQWTQEDIDYIYEGLDTYESAKQCLKDYNRDINYPLLDEDSTVLKRQHFAYNAVSEIYACNIMPEVMSCLVYNDQIKHRKEYQQITDVKFNYITEPIKVYSLKVDGETYVADNIVTHNSIYSFKGGNFRHFMDLINDKEVKVYELNNCYRCGLEIIDFADTFLYPVEDIYKVPVQCKSGKLGNVLTMPFSIDNLLMEIVGNNYGDIFILTRTNREIEDVKFILDREGIPNDTFKKSDLDLGSLNELLMKDSVKILTVHSAKGLEAKKVIVLGVKTWSNEERRICYVAATRAQDELVWLTTKKKTRRREQVMTWG